MTDTHLNDIGWNIVVDNVYDTKNIHMVARFVCDRIIYDKRKEEVHKFDLGEILKFMLADADRGTVDKMLTALIRDHQLHTSNIDNTLLECLRKPITDYFPNRILLFVHNTYTRTGCIPMIVGNDFKETIDNGSLQLLSDSFNIELIGRMYVKYTDVETLPEELKIRVQLEKIKL